MIKAAGSDLCTTEQPGTSKSAQKKQQRIAGRKPETMEQFKAMMDIAAKKDSLTTAGKKRGRPKISEKKGWFRCGKYIFGTFREFK